MSIRRSLTFSFLDRYAGLAITILSSVLIARLLTPAELGVYSVTMVLMTFAATLRDMGAGQYLVQEKDLTVERVRAVWTVQLGLGVGLALVILAISHPVALFYGDSRMRDIMFVVALNYAINPFGSLTHSWLMREMRFDSSAIIRLAGGITSACVSVYLAWQGYGPISLAIGTLSSTVVCALIAIHFRPAFFPWRPGLRGIRQVLVFGSHLTATSIVGVISAGAPELLLGKLQNVTTVGLFSRASGLVQMFHRLFVDAVSAVCLPWFSRQSREQDSVAAPFLKASAYITAFGWAFCIGIVCLAHPVIIFLYGDQWHDAVDLARLLAAAMAFNVPTALCQIALLSSGGVAKIPRIAIAIAVQTIVFVGVGASLGLMWLGVCMIAAAAISAIIWLNATCKHIGIPFRVLARSWVPSALVALLAGIAPGVALLIYGPYPTEILPPLMVGVVGGLTGFVIGVVIFKHPVKNEFERMFRTPA